MENRVHRFLALTDNTIGMVAEGTQLYNLSTGAFNITDGQLGLFNYETKAAVETTWTGVKKVFFAVGVDSDGDGTVDTLVSSLPITVGKNLVEGYEKQSYTCPKPQVKFLRWDDTNCETEYCLKINLSGVPISEALGWNVLPKSFHHETDCCDDGDNCETLAADLVSLINNDPDGLFTAAVVSTGDFTVANDDATAYEDFYVSYNGTVYTTALTAVADSAVGAALLAEEMQALLDSSGVDGTAAVTFNATTDFTVVITNTIADEVYFYAGGETQTGGAGAITFTDSNTLLSANPPAMGSFTNGATIVIQGSNGNDGLYTISTVPAATGFDIAEATFNSTASQAATTITVSEVTLLTATDSDSCDGISITANFDAVADFCNIPVNLVEPNGVYMEIVGGCGFDCNLTVTEAQALQYEQGNGYYVKMYEQEATGYGADHLYRFSGILTNPDPSRTMYTDPTQNYILYVIDHVDLHKGAPSGHYFRSEQRTIIAVPDNGTDCDAPIVAYSSSTLETDLDAALAAMPL